MTEPAATILIVDDEVPNRKLLEALLRPEGYLTLTAASGEEALVAVAARAPDLILLDVMMPGVDGYQVASLLKADPATSNIPIIMVTALIDRKSRMAGLESGVEEFITKPVDRAELWLRVRNLLRLKEMGNLLRNHSQVLERQVEERTSDLHASELRFRQMAENITEVFWLRDLANNEILYVSPAYEKIWGRTCESLYASPRGWVDAIHAEDRERVLLAARTKQASGEYVEEYRVGRPDGTIRWIHDRAFPVFRNEREVYRIAGLASDITQRKLAEIRIKRLNRVYAVLSNINMLIVRVRNRDELFKGACRIAVQQGEFPLAWLGIVDQTAMKIVPVASAGADDLFNDEIRDRMSLNEASPAKQDLSVIAVLEKQVIVVNDVETDPRVLDKKALADRGIRSVVILPLLLEEEPVAVLGLYAAEAGYFDEAEINLLSELAADIAFAIDHINKRERLDYLAYYDALTGLPNRMQFQATLKNTLALAATSGWLVAVLYIDVDRFKNVNDTLGHTIGDELLRQFSNRLVQCVRIRETVGRLGGDEFALMLRLEDGRKVSAANVATKIRDALRTPFDLNGHEVTVTASVGITVHPDDASDPDALMKYADTAMYRAKQAGRDTFRFFTPQMNTEVMARLDLETALRKAVKNDEFVLYYQPKVQINSGRIVGFEALLRWQRPGRGLVPPNDFVPVLEETGLIVRVGSWVIATACRQISLWMRSPIGPVQISVNVSGRQFTEGDLYGDVTKALADNDIAADLLELELTESSVMTNTESTLASMADLKKRGVHISIDDFGTGYSSLAYLRRFPIDILKIDIAFVRDITTNSDDAAIVLAIIRMAHSLELEVIAEGVETAAQLAYLRRIGCNYIQGSYFSRPMPAPEAEQMLRDEKRLPAPEGDADGSITGLSGP